MNLFVLIAFSLDITIRPSEKKMHVKLDSPKKLITIIIILTFI